MGPKQHTIPLREKITILTTNLATNICCELDSNGRQLPRHVMALLTIHLNFKWIQSAQISITGIPLLKTWWTRHGDKGFQGLWHTVVSKFGTLPLSLPFDKRSFERTVVAAFGESFSWRFGSTNQDDSKSNGDGPRRGHHIIALKSTCTVRVYDTVLHTILRL
jgi:hypothetical protein